MSNEEIVKVKIRALEIARDMKPGPVYSGFGQQPVTPYYDVLKEAQSIYEWIVKK
jgi:hypothetical protein